MTTTANASAAAEIVATASSLIPKQRRERVVEQAVGDEAVAPRVPEVVPEREAVLEEDRPLVHVGGEIGTGRHQPDEERGHERRGAARRDCLPGQRGRAQGHAFERHDLDAIAPLRSQGRGTSAAE